MDHVTLLNLLYRAYQTDDKHTANQLLIAYPKIAGETITMILKSQSRAEFMEAAEQKE